MLVYKLGWRKERGGVGRGDVDVTYPWVWESGGGEGVDALPVCGCGGWGWGEEAVEEGFGGWHFFWFLVFVLSGGVLGWVDGGACGGWLDDMCGGLLILCVVVNFVVCERENKRGGVCTKG